MKKYLILTILLFGYLNVYAFEGKYNYEVTNIILVRENKLKELNKWLGNS